MFMHMHDFAKVGLSLALHISQQCIEIVVSHNGIESKRLYVDMIMVKSKIVESNLKDRIDYKKEMLLRQRKSARRLTNPKFSTISTMKWLISSYSRDWI
jgi:hypothetical protein